MDRLSWYQTGESMEEILCQAGAVGIYDGDVKQSSFEQGTVSLTYQRVIWADSNDPDCRLMLHHSLVQRIEKQNKSMFGRGAKILVSVRPVPSDHPQGPISARSTNSLRFIFRNGGEEDFFKRYTDALGKQMWQRASSSSSSASSLRTAGTQHLSISSSGTTHSNLMTSHQANTMGIRNVGILGIEKRLAEQHQRTHEHISEAFEDMSKLMDQAREMVNLSRNIAERIRQKKGEITDDETVRLKSYLLSLGVADPVTKSVFGAGAVFFERLAQELTNVLYEPLQECGGTMTLADAYCRWNRARGLELVSPEDLLNSCNKLEKINSPICLYTFDNGVQVLQLCSLNMEKMAEEILEMVNATTDNGNSINGFSAAHLAKHSGISLILASERLRMAEDQGKLCRDDTIEGLFFYPNKFNLLEDEKEEIDKLDVNKGIDDI
ncbi:hypothetical protein ACQ4LE_005842 [Meloidogyne hapla]|uniref:Vacuolar protein-sorting-associated protein 36 n=1 Tax=Meloidogyne hapla TaxID=6305 RepID=A0A1I8C277_MELHA